MSCSGARPSGLENRTLQKYEGKQAEMDRHAAKMRERNTLGAARRKSAMARWSGHTEAERKSIMAKVRDGQHKTSILRRLVEELSQ